MICADIIGERSRLSPDRTAVVEVATGARFTYRELNHCAAATARSWLYGLGLKYGDRIGILSGNRIEFLDTFFAAAKSGVILVPLGTRLTAAELTVIVSDCGLSALVYGVVQAGALPPLRRGHPRQLEHRGDEVDVRDRYRLPAGGDPRI